MASPNISSGDIQALHSIIKKLGLSLPKVLLMQTQLKSDKLSSVEKQRKLFGLKKNEDPEEYIKSRLSESEIKTLKNAIGAL